MVKVTPYDSNGDAVSALFQWDKGIEVTVEDDSITEAYNMHFANTQTGEAYVVESTYSSRTLTAQIPDVLLQSTNPVFGYVYDEDDDSGRSTLWFKIKVTARAQPADYVFEDSADYVTITGIIDTIKEYMESAADSAEAAAESEENAADSATLAESWAVGGTGTRDGEDTDNAEYYAGIAASNAAEALGFYYDTDGYMYCSDADEDDE